MSVVQSLSVSPSPSPLLSESSSRPSVSRFVKSNVKKPASLVKSVSKPRTEAVATTRTADRQVLEAAAPTLATPRQTRVTTTSSKMTPSTTMMITIVVSLTSKEMKNFKTFVVVRPEKTTKKMLSALSATKVMNSVFLVLP